MNIKRCNFCNKILDKKVESYYTIGEISKHVLQSRCSRVIFSKQGENSEDINQIQESWVDYSDLDFCEPCWQKNKFKQFFNNEL